LVAEGKRKAVVVVQEDNCVYNYKTLAKKTNPPPNEVASYFTSFEATLRQQQSEGDNRELKRRTSEASDQDAMSCAQRICL